MKKRNWVLTWLWVLVILMLLLPALQSRFGLIKSKDLDGFFAAAAQPSFTYNAFGKGEFQEKYRAWLEENTGFRSDFVRLYNQVDFSLFALPHASKIIIGKKNFLFGEQYIRAWRGDDFVGMRYVNQKVRELKYVCDRLWKEKGIFVLVVFAPDKGTFYPEYIPEKYRKNRKNLTNYSVYVKKYQEAGIPFIDFNRLFLQMKDTSRYSLYPKSGIHWSDYGAVLAADSLARYLQAKLNLHLPGMVRDCTVVTHQVADVDNDICRTLNLIWDIPSPLMAYPVYHFVSDSATTKPNVLFVGDSFYWNWYYPGIIGNLFGNQDFWYYDNEVYPAVNGTLNKTSNIDFMEAIGKQRAIVLLQTNAGYGDPGYSFTDRAYTYLDGPSRIRYHMEKMTTNPLWMESLKKKAAEQKSTLRGTMMLDAIYLANQELLPKK
jgi:hypothetical protein